MTMTAVEGEVQPKKDQAKSGPYRELQHGLIDIARIEIRAQHRKLFNERAMKELTDNVRHVGILEPILLRFKEAGKNGYILIAGERRLRAAKGAGLLQIPSRVLDVTEEQAAEIQALENLHRQDLGPIDEARAFKTLLDARKYTVKQLSERMDKSEAYVYRAVRLLELPEKVLNAIADGTLTAAHGHQILRAPEQHWEELTERAFDSGIDGGITTAANFAEEVDDVAGKNLSSAIFPKDKPFAEQVACTNCPYNSGNQGMLFDGAQKGKCFNGKCFDLKSEQYVADLVDKGRGLATKTGLQFVGEGKEQGYGSDTRLKGHKILSSEEAKKAKDPKKYGVGVVTGSQYSSDKPHIVTVRLAEKEKPAGKSTAAARQHDYERERVVDDAAQEAEYTAVCTAAKDATFGREDLNDCVWKALGEWQYLANHIKAAWGIKKWDAASIAALTESQAIGVIRIMAREGDDVAKRLKVNVAKVRADAKAAAGKAYDEQKTAKKGGK